MGMKLLTIRPLLFISYSREDVEIAQAVNDSLLRENYLTFFDKKSILLGETFPEKITASLKKCDGCIAIISNNSIKSEWCKLELYYAHLLKKPIIPIRVGKSEFDVASPLNNLQKKINYTVLDDISHIPATISLVKDRLVTTRHYARNRLIKSIVFIASVVIAVLIGFLFTINHLNGLKQERDKEALIEQVKKSNKIFRAPELDVYSKSFTNDQDLFAKLHSQELDPGLSSVARINSKILSAALLRSFNLAARQYHQNIDWGLSTFENGMLVNSTFSGGTIHQTTFRNVVFSDIFFTGSNEGKFLNLSALKFNNCDFSGITIEQTQLIDITFTNSRFRGSSLDLTNVGAVNFLSSPERGPVITNGQVTYFENCLFTNNTSPDEKGVMVLGKEEEVQFHDVVFKGCRFTGLVRPEWFINCSFEDCIFPDETSFNALGKSNSSNHQLN